ncbi:hypothetical protein K437DRAFT_256865 [Tilletiaria anomala UBC 951]|uniref:RING-type E3 ubiquitin transferase n=1 Tax=Tilletiaria anomala (strain ATCC 24038 / CBS 436.72 / UBC 951) TaxID=1037660 RepID=A0A066VSL0_TILAU|nr:uncharacterized protein K437DRAFT_256865 [Tilletiaria anomala UBC 951]KDN44722.1 hypothetical protein K437DRAFT_256865 [Tilletiaria anomala UBC 951]
MAAAPNLDSWKQRATEGVFKVTLDRNKAEDTAWDLIYLKDVAEELSQENAGQAPIASPDIADRLLIARLQLDPDGENVTDDADKLTALASLDKEETCWDYLIRAWRRCKQEELSLKKTLPNALAPAQAVLDELRGLIVSYLGLLIQTPDMFPCNTKPNGKAINALCLLPSIVKTSSFVSMGAFPSTSSSQSALLKNEWASVEPHETPFLLADLANRFSEGDDFSELQDILGPTLQEISRRILEGEEVAPSSSRGPPTPGGTGGSAAPPPALAGRGQLSPQALAQAAQTGNIQAVLAHLLGQRGAARMPGANTAGAQDAMDVDEGDDAFTDIPGALRKTKEGPNITGLEWRPYLTALVEAAGNKRIAEFMTKLNSFDPEGVKTPQLERKSLLGPILRLSVFPDAYPSITEQFFSNAKSRNRADIEMNANSLRSTMEIVQSSNFRICNSIVRSGPMAREEMLRYWGRACDLNAKRAGMRVKASAVSTDAFMVNLFELTLRFAEPFMDASYSKIDRIDMEYFRHQKRFDAANLTRLNASEPEAAKWVSDAGTAASAPNFITETFYLATRLCTLGPVKVIRNYQELEKDMRRMKKRADEYEGDREQWASTPQAPQYEAFIKRTREAVDRMQSTLIAYNVQLLDPAFVTRMVSFTSLVMTWLIRVADPRRAHPRKMVELPLPDQAAVEFTMLPEHIFEDVCEFLLFIAKYRPQSLTEPAKNDLVSFCTTFLLSSAYIKNPFLKAKLAEILYYNLWEYGNARQGILGDTINIHPLALCGLVPALMSFWVEAESTGSHTQFYDKFNIRAHLCKVFETIWTTPQHKQRVQEESKKARFVTFINRMMNDVTFLLDDALEKLQELHNKQQLMDNPAEWAALTGEQQQEHSSHMRGVEEQVGWMLQYGHQFLNMLIKFTEETKDAFMEPEIVDRLAAMLDFNLDVLVGPRCQELKVKEPKKVGFNPRHLLQQILSVYLNLAARKEFIKAIAKDGRSYKKEIFVKAASIASRHMLKSPAEIEALGGLIEHVEETKGKEEEEEEDLGEIPDEYTDPLMATLMKDPVRLPSSKAILDRATIKAHLLSDASDPFNRMPLKIEDVLPADDLRAEIEAFVAARRKNKTAS